MSNRRLEGKQCPPSIDLRSRSVRTFLIKSTPGLARNALLACGILAALLYAVGHDLLAAALYRGYSPFWQTVSELSSIGAPTRPAVTAVVLVHEALLIAFGIGVGRSARGNRPLHVTGGLLDCIRSRRSALAAIPDQGTRSDRDNCGLQRRYACDLGALTILLELSIIGFGAAAFGGRFLLYSILTFAAVVLFWGLSFLYAPRLGAGEPTPWLGVIERIALGVWLSWLAVLAIVVMRGPRALSSRRRREGSAD